MESLATSVFLTESPLLSEYWRQTKKKTFCGAISVYQQNMTIDFYITNVSTPFISCSFSCGPLSWLAYELLRWAMFCEVTVTFGGHVIISSSRGPCERLCQMWRNSVSSGAVKVHFSYPPSIISSTTRNTPSMLSSKYLRSTFFLQRKMQLSTSTPWHSIKNNIIKGFDHSPEVAISYDFTLKFWLNVIFLLFHLNETRLMLAPGDYYLILASGQDP